MALATLSCWILIRRCNARNKYNTVTTTLFTDANKIKLILRIQIDLIPNNGEIDGHGKCTIFQVMV